MDEELRQKIATALGENAANDGLDSASDTSSDLRMDDDQMMQLDGKLADIFRAHSSGSKTKTSSYIYIIWLQVQSLIDLPTYIFQYLVYNEKRLISRLEF